LVQFAGIGFHGYADKGHNKVTSCVVIKSSLGIPILRPDSRRHLRRQLVLAYLLALTAAHTLACAGTDTADTSMAAWSLAFEPRPLQTELARCLTVFDEDLLIAGCRSRQPRAGIEGIARWDGSEYRPMGRVGIGFLDFAQWRGSLVAGGWKRGQNDSTGVLAQWDGNTWRNFGKEIRGSVQALTAWRGLLVVGGQFRVEGLRGVRNLAFWDGKHWSAPPTTGLGGPHTNRLIIVPTRLLGSILHRRGVEV